MEPSLKSLWSNICELLKNQYFPCPSRQRLIFFIENEQLLLQLHYPDTPIYTPEYSAAAENLTLLDSDNLEPYVGLLLGFTPYFSHLSFTSHLDPQLTKFLTKTGKLILDAALPKEPVASTSRYSPTEKCLRYLKDLPISTWIPRLGPHKESLLVEKQFLDPVFKVPKFLFTSHPTIIGAAYVANNQ